jgi:hypothetical protein
MTTDREIGRILDHWLSDGPTAAPDRMVDVLADRIGHQSQRPAWRLDRRLPAMNPYIKVITAIAAVILVAVIGYNLLPAGTGTGVPGPSATPTPSAAPLPTPEAVLPAGRYFQLPGPQRVTFDVPDGWRLTEAFSGGLAFIPVAGEAGDTIRVFYDMRPASRDDQCSEVPEPGYGPAAHDVLAGVAATPGVDAGPIQPIEIGEIDGEILDVTMSSTWTRPCPFSNGSPTVPLIVDTITSAEGPFWGLGPLEKERLIAFDVPGWSNVVVVIDSIDGSTFEALTTQAMPFAESLTVDATS